LKLIYNPYVIIDNDAVMWGLGNIDKLI